MNKQDIYKFLKDKKIWHEVLEHQAVFNMKDLEGVHLPYPKINGKNLFVRDDKKKNYYLITVKGDKRVNLKEFRKKNQTRALSFASESDLKDILNLRPGSVTPFGILNDRDLKVVFYLDQAFLEDVGLIGVHPNENTATIWLKVKDLIDIIKEHGNQVNIIEL